MRFQNSERSAEKNRKAEDAGGRTGPDAELGADQAATKAWLVRYDAALALPVSQRHALLRERLAHVGNDAVIRPPFFCDYGYNIRLGRQRVPELQLRYPRRRRGQHRRPRADCSGSADLCRRPSARCRTRRSGVEFGRPVRIGSGVWIGRGAILLPGVSIGDGAVIGAGSLVTRDVGAGVMVTGNPTRPHPK
jgi:maltose O-acetyltransferase